MKHDGKHDGKRGWDTWLGQMKEKRDGEEEESRG